MLKVPKGQDHYSVIGQYIQNHITAIEDIIATIEIDGVRTNELFTVDMQEDGYFVWKSDWYEGEQNVALIDFFPVSDAIPERQGKWLDGHGFAGNYYDCFVCDQCKKESMAKTKYCPNCGAKMDGEQDDRLN